MLQVRHLARRYGTLQVLSGISFTINRDERVGLVGPNGCGKSTLLRCIVGAEVADAGNITTLPGTQIGYLPQSLAEAGDCTVDDLLGSVLGDWRTAEQDVCGAAERIASDSASDAAFTRYTEALARFETLGKYDYEHRARGVLDGLGLAQIDLSTLVSQLSGGQKTRLGLASLLLAEPDLLLLDEPTNHLDIEALEWLEAFVRDYPGAVLIVSHDREFLDRTVERILYLDPVTRSVRSYPGTYSQFAAMQAEERLRHERTWADQQEYIQRVEGDIAWLKGEARATERSTTPRQPGVRKLARRKAARAKAREKKLERYLESDERVEKPRLSWGLKLDFGPPPSGGQSVLHLEDVSFAYPDEPPLFAGVTFDVQHAERVAIVGPNGAGKSTLLTLIDGGLTPTHGEIRIGANIKLGVLAQEHETLDPGESVLQTVLAARPMSETDARHFLHFFLFGGDSVFRRVGGCSFGERTRLQLALLVLRGCNLLLLDEPLNHLDIDGREHLEAALNAFEGTIIAVVHDRAFLRSFPERIIELRAGSAHVHHGNYDDYLAGRQ